MRLFCCVEEAYGLFLRERSSWLNANVTAESGILGQVVFSSRLFQLPLDFSLAVKSVWSICFAVLISITELWKVLLARSVFSGSGLGP